MGNLPDNTPKKRPHPVAERVVRIIRKTLLDCRGKKGITEKELGERTFEPLGWSDGQKKINNLLNSKTDLSIADFYVLCEGLGLPPDRVFVAAVFDALKDCESAAEQPFKKKVTQDQEAAPPGPGNLLDNPS